MIAVRVASCFQAVCRRYVVLGSQGCSRIRSQFFGDGDGEVSEINILILRGGEVTAGASKEGLHLQTPDLARLASPENKTTEVHDRLSIDKEFQFPIGLSNVVEPDAFRDSSPLASREGESATAERSTIGGVAIGVLYLVAEPIVVAGREVSIYLTLALAAPHETSREASVGATATGTAKSLSCAITTIEARELTTLLEGETIREEDRIAESRLLRSGEVDIGWTKSVERESTLGFVLEIVRALRVVSFHGAFALWTINVRVREILHFLGWPEDIIRQGASIGRAGTGGPG